MRVLGGAIALAVPAGAGAQAFDERLVAAVADLERGAYLLLVAVCYLLGVLALGSGLFRLVRQSENRLRTESGVGTVLCFAGGVVMISFPSWLQAGGESLFGTGAVTALSYSAAGEDAERYNALLGAVLAIVQFVGVASFLKGWFVLRDAADGWARATMGSGVWHIVGGLMGWHIVPVLDALQGTLGVELLQAS